MTEAIFKPIQLRMIALLVLVPYAIMANPIYGMKRYGRSTAHPQSNGWGVSSMMHLPAYYYQTLPRPQTYHPYSYYDAMNLYAPEYDDYYYPQDPLAYPLYYPSFSRSGSGRYDLYQPYVPIYYAPNPYDYYEGSDPMGDLQEEVLQEEEREQREEAYPVGQETWFEPERSEAKEDSIDDVNAAFMKNLMLYNSAMAHPAFVYGQAQEPDSFQDYSAVNSWSPEPYTYEDKDEQDLHMLTEAPKKQKSKSNKKQSAAQERLQMLNKNSNSRSNKNRYEANNSESWLKYGNNKRDAELAWSTRKPQSGLLSSTEQPVSISPVVGDLRDARGGQKEVVMMRPATPVRRPFSEPVMRLLAQQGGPERKRTPSVYDTIKHMLEMEKSLEKQQQQYGQHSEYFHPAMKKRFVTSEESLVEELSGLKKTANFTSSVAMETTFNCV